MHEHVCTLKCSLLSRASSTAYYLGDCTGTRGKNGWLIRFENRTRSYAGLCYVSKKQQKNDFLLVTLCSDPGSHRMIDTLHPSLLHRAAVDGCCSSSSFMSHDGSWLMMNYAKSTGKEFQLFALSSTSRNNIQSASVSRK